MLLFTQLHLDFDYFYFDYFYYTPSNKKYKVCSKGIKTAVVFTKTEMSDE